MTCRFLLPPLILAASACAHPIYLGPPPLLPEVPEALVAPPPDPDHPLATFFRALEALDVHAVGATATVLHLGASHTASDTFTGPVRQVLQRRFGDGGRGLFAAGTPWRWFHERDATFAASRSWTYSRATSSRAEGTYGIAAVRSTGTKEEAWIDRGTCSRCEQGATFSELIVHAVQGPEEGEMIIEIDGEAREPISLLAEEAGAVRYTFALDDVPHEVRVSVLTPPVSLLGIETLRPQGLRYVNLGVNGSRADQWLRMDEDRFVADVAHLDPDLVVLHWGINETTVFVPPDISQATPEDYRRAAAPQTASYLGVLERVRARNPDVSCLLLLPTDLVPRTHPALAPPEPDTPTEPVEDDAIAADEEGAEVEEPPDPTCVGEALDPRVPEPYCVRPVPPNLAAIADAQRAAAVQAGCAVWDLQAAMGGPGASNLWRALDPPLMARDGIHLTLRGYRALAEGFAEDLLRAYAGWRGAHAPNTPLELTPIDVDQAIATP